MEHIDVMTLLRNFFQGQRTWVVPGTSLSDYNTFEEWKTGVKRHHQMVELLDLLEELISSTRLG